MRGNQATPCWLKGAQTADGMFAIDHDRRVVLWNRAAEAMLGFAANEAIGNRCYELLGDGRRPGKAFCRAECVVVANAQRSQPTPAVNILCKTSSGALRNLNFSTLVTDGSENVQLVHFFRAAGAWDGSKAGLPDKGSAGVAGAWREDARPLNAPLRAPPALSKREAEVLSLLARGFDTSQIAVALGVKRVTARNHIGRLLDRLGARTRLQAVVIGNRLGLIED
jgi:DNA-binding CsgD family transcriptional regulator